jgi:hypothetical protein
VTRLRCDHHADEETGAVFARVSEAGGTLDLLVNSAWGGYERMVEGGVYLVAALLAATAPPLDQHDGRWGSRRVCLQRSRRPG